MTNLSAQMLHGYLGFTLLVRGFV